MSEPPPYRPLFGSQPFGNDQSSSVNQGQTNTPGNQSLFASSGSKLLFGTPNAQNVEPGVQKPSIFGGSAFSKPPESSFAAPARQSIFGGPVQASTSLSLNIPKTEENVSQSGASGKSQPIFGGAFNMSADMSMSGTSHIFGGAFGGSQIPTSKPTAFADMTSPTTEPSSTTKPSIFGGAFSKKEELTSRSGPAAPLKVQDSVPDMPRGILSKSSSEESKLTVDKQSLSSSANRFSSFSPSKPVFGRFSSSGIVTSTLSPPSHDRSDYMVVSNDLDRKTNNNIADQSVDSELDTLGDENLEDSGITQSKESTRSNKIVRKRGVFGKAIEDMPKLSPQSPTTEENRSIICHPVGGELVDASVFKDHFSKFGRPTVSINKEKRYAIATYKTAADAQKAMEGDRFIDGVKFKFFWRNMAKARRKSAEEGEKKSPDVKKKPPRQLEMDASVKEELEAMSGIEYYVPKDVSSKRKVSMSLEARKKSRSQAMGRNSDQEALEEKQDLSQRFEGGKDIRSRPMKNTRETRPDEKASVRTRIERKSTKKSAISTERDEITETKPEKGELSATETTIVPTAAISELQEILKQQALTSDDKLKVLEARDKMMRLRQVKQYDISKAVKTVGTCPDMCPEKERILRETRRQISLYEMSSLKPNEMDPNLMVKQYSRSSADQEEPLPHELRPPAVLTMTMNYLMHNIMSLGDQPGENLGDWYHFLWDRLRGIRKEITQQELCDVDAVHLVEQCARFHIHCGGRLVAEDMSVFDDRINTENLTKCLQTLKHMYHDLWTNNSITCQNESEFISYFLLLNLNTGIIMWEMEQLREEVLKSPEIAFVAAMYNSLSSNNFVRFFRLVRKASYLNSCLCIRYFVQVREKALGTYVKALAKIRPVQYPLSALVEEMGFENTERAAAFCTHYGLMTDNESTSVTLSPDTFGNPTYRFPSERALRLAESKKMGSVGEVVNGGPLASRSFDGHCVHESFDENGYLRKDAFYAKDQGLSDFGLNDNELVGQTSKPENNTAVRETVGSPLSATQRTDSLNKNLLQVPTVIFGNSGYQNVFSSTFSNLQPATSAPVTTTSSLLKSVFTRPSQNSLEKQDISKLNSTQNPSVFEPIKRLLPMNPFMDQAQADAQAKAQAQAKQQAEMRAHAELEDSIKKASEHEVQELLQSCVKEFTAEIALLEWSNAEEEDRAQEQRRVEEQFRAQEELRKRILDAHIDRISSDSLSDILQEVVGELISTLAEETHSNEEKLVEHVKILSQESLNTLLNCVMEELSYNVASEELKQAQDLARQESVKNRVKQVFYFWLERARRSLHRRHVMEDFPASVIPLSVKEHAERWGFPEDIQANALEACSKGTEKTLDFLELKALRAYPQIAFAELVGVQVVHRYDTVRSKLDLRPTDKLLYKTFVSVPEDFKDPATQLIDWWIRRTFKQNCTMLCDDMKKGLFRLVSGVKVTSEVAVYASLQMVRGQNPLKKQPGLVSGSSAVLFTVSPTSNLLEGKARLSLLLKSMRKLPALPLVVAVISSLEPPIEGLKQLAQELDLDQWLSGGVICDYQILHVRDLFDIKYLSERFNMAFNYMVMTWTPSPEFSLVCFKNVLKSTFQMFYISIQFNHNSSEIYPQDVDDPRVIVGLCNEWLDHMCCEFVESYYEARVLCGDEFWPLIYKGAYLPFLNNPSYVQILQKVILAVHLPTIEWPPSSEADFESLMAHYCSWLGPDEKKQTLRRLSCLNGLAWPDKLKNIPWVNLIEDWMEARINYLETCALFGTELLCLMRTPNVEHLYTYPWWAQSRYILSYLETRGSGGNCAMDVDQTVPDENLPHGEMSVDETLEEPISSGLQQLQEVTNSVNELKSANESLLKRIQTALADGSETCTQPVNNLHIVNNATNLQTDAKEANSTTLPDLKSIVDTIDRQVQAERDFRTNLNLLFSQALDEDKKSEKPTTVIKNTESELTSTALTVSQSVHEADTQGNSKTSTKTMDEIMASVNNIVSSLDQKYKILDSSSCFERISDLKMGVGKVEDVAMLLTSEDLHPSPFVEQSQRRMHARLLGSEIQDTESISENPVPLEKDSDLEMLSDDRSTSTVLRTGSSASSSNASEYNESDSEAEVDFDRSAAHSSNNPRCQSQNENLHHQHHQSDKEDGNRRRKRPQQYRSDSDSDFQSGKRTQLYHSDSEEDVNSAKRTQHCYSDSEDEVQSEKTSQLSHSESEDDDKSETVDKKLNRGSTDDGKRGRRRQHHHSKMEDPDDSNSSTYDYHYDSEDSTEKGEHNSSDQESTQLAQQQHQNNKVLGLSKHKVHEPKSEDVESDSGSSEHAINSDCDDNEEDDDEEEVQTISSEDSRDSIANHVEHSSVSESASHHNDNYFITETNPSSVNYVVCENELASENGLISEGDGGRHLINLDNIQNHYHYYEGNVEMSEGNTYYTMSSDVGILHAEDINSEVVLSNSDQNEENHVIMLEPSSENAVQNIYDVELDQEENQVCDESVVHCSGETLNSSRDEDVDGQFSEERATLSKENDRHSQFAESDSVEEECEEEEEEGVEEEECEGLEEEGDGDEELEEAMEEEGEEEAELAVESETDEDSDVCEVIDD